MSDAQELVTQLNHLDPRLLSRLALDALFLFERFREKAGAAAVHGASKRRFNPFDGQ
jgi:hypothetical protein